MVRGWEGATESALKDLLTHATDLGLVAVITHEAAAGDDCDLSLIHI